MSRSYLMRRPRESDEEDSDPDIVHSKPIQERYARSLGSTFQGKDFVRGSAKSQQQFYGAQTVEDGTDGSVRPLTADERNKLSAKILKAEMKGNMELVAKLKRQLESGVTDGGEPSTSSSSTSKEVVLMTTDKRTGQAVPARKPAQKGYAEEKTKGTVDNEYRRVRDLREMVAEEKSTTAEDQLTMFDRAAKMCSDNKVDDDWNVDDNIMSHPKKRRHGERDEKKSSQKRVKEHKDLERTLDSCKLCIDSKRIEKQTVVTYLAVIPWDGLAEDHCMIVPTAHYTNSVTLDEDVYDEMRLWRKGLVAMWNSEDQDCVFIEMVRDPTSQKHMSIECIPLPREVGDTAPIYFKKAIMESESEWSDNKKLIDLSKFRNGDIRKAIPKGFPYFSVDFGLQAGYAHVIEDVNAFPANFAHEIVGGMLDLHHRHWRNTQPMPFEEVKKKRDALREKWKPFDWTEIAKKATKASQAHEDE